MPSQSGSRPAPAKTATRRSTDGLSKGEHTRQRLVRAARTLLSEDGAAPFTTRNVAALCGVSHAMCYYHFTDRSELLVAVVDDMRGDWVDPLDRAVGSSGSFDERRRRVSALLSKPESNELVRLHSALHWFAMSDDALRSALRQQYLDWTACFVRLYQVLAEEGRTDQDPAILGAVTASGVDGLAALDALGALADPGAVLDAMMARQS